MPGCALSEATTRPATATTDADSGASDAADPDEPPVVAAEVAEEPEPEEGEPEAEAATPFTERDALLDPIDKELARRLKRALADEQNEVLDLLRRAKPAGVADLLPDADEHAARWTEVVTTALVDAAAAGAGVVRREAPVPSPTWPTSWPARSPRRCAIASTAASPPPTATSTTSPTGSEPCTGSGRARGSPTRPATTRPRPTPAGCSTPRPAAPRSTGWSIRSEAGAPTATTTCSEATSRRAASSPPGHTCAPAHPGCRCLVLAANR